LVEWIADNQALERAVAQWREVIGLDTEFIRTNTYYPLPGLYQIASGDDVFLLDPAAIDQWQPFTEYLADPNTTKIMHACLEDLELLNHHLGVNPVNVFDTQYANAFVSADFSLSYAALVERNLGVHIEKHETRSNWLQRPLTDNQISYAVEDVTYLGPLYEQLSEQLQKLDRQSWFAPDMRTREIYSSTDPLEYYRSVKKAWHLPGQKLAVLKALCAWRETTARAEDVPRKRIVWDEHLYEFSQVDELTSQHIEHALPRGVARRYGDALVEQHRQGSNADLVPTAVPRPLSSAQGATVKMLRKVALSMANKLDMAPELIGRKKDLEACVRHHAENAALSPRYGSWRGALVADQFSAVLQQRTGAGI